MRLASFFAPVGMGLSLLMGASPAAAQKPLSVNKTAPEFVGTTWLNTPGHAPLTLAARRGKVTIVHFWTFGCINCKHNLPSYLRWQKQFAGRDVAIIGVHTPETAYERDTGNIAREVERQGITFPVLLDVKGANWTRWQQQFWPTVYLVDKRGCVRYRWEGELEYHEAGGEAAMAGLVDKLLKEAGEAPARHHDS